MAGVVALAGFSGLGAVDLARAEEAPSEEAVPAPPGKIEFVGKNLIATANGTFHRWHVAARTFDPTARGAGEVYVKVELASLDTGNARRDDHLRTADFFDVEKYPFAHIRGHSLTRESVNEAGQPVIGVQFDIDLHGVEKTVPGTLIQTSNRPMTFQGELVIDRLAFGIGPEVSRWNPMSISQMIPVRFEIEL